MKKVKIEWSANFAYAIGLLVTDGCLYPNRRHMSMTSKDIALLELFKRCLGLKNKITLNCSGSGNYTSRIQFGDVNFYSFLIGIGLMPKKSKIIGSANIPDRYFFDFLRGHFDGDGTFHAYFDHRWKSSYMFYMEFLSASAKHIAWIRNSLTERLSIKGHISKSATDSVYKLRYAKNESLKLLPRLYYNPDVACLFRKRKKIETALSVIDKRL